MNYLETYFSRINHMGETTAERIRNGGIRSFENWKAESPHTIRHLSVERGIYFDGIILENKDKEYKKIMFLNVSNFVKIDVGDIMNWKQDNGEIEKWLLLQEEKKVNGTYRTFQIIKCNYLLKWIDADGHLQDSWSYVVSSVDSKIKGNFRTWHNLITPQPNKYAEIIMPRRPIRRATNFIIEDESWIVIEYDHTSVPGVIYLSLTENKVNLIYDDLENNIADTDKLAQYTILVPQETEEFVLGEVMNLTYTLTKNGTPIDMEVEVLTNGSPIVQMINDELVAVGEGESDIIIRLKDYPTISNTVHIKINESDKGFSGYIEGKDKIVLDRINEYKFIGTDELVNNVEFSVNTNLVKIISTTNGTCTIHANDKNEIGEFILTALYDGVEYTKTIKVIPLW